MTSLPKWVIEFDEMNSCCTSISDYKKLHEALSIAWKAMERARHWQNVRGLSPQGALEQVEVDLFGAMQIIEQLGERE